MVRLALSRARPGVVMYGLVRNDFSPLQRGYLCSSRKFRRTSRHSPRSQVEKKAEMNWWNGVLFVASARGFPFQGEFVYPSWRRTVFLMMRREQYYTTRHFLLPLIRNPQGVCVYKLLHSQNNKKKKKKPFGSQLLQVCSHSLRSQADGCTRLIKSQEAYSGI